MNSRERVLCSITHKEPDRVPMNIWMFRNDTSEKVCERYGSLERFYERYNIDIHMTITPPPYLTNLSYEEEKMDMEPYEICSEHAKELFSRVEAFSTKVVKNLLSLGEEK